VPRRHGALDVAAAAGQERRRVAGVLLRAGGRRRVGDGSSALRLLELACFPLLRAARGELGVLGERGRAWRAVDVCGSGLWCSQIMLLCLEGGGLCCKVPQRGLERVGAWFVAPWLDGRRGKLGTLGPARRSSRVSAGTVTRLGASRHLLRAPDSPPVLLRARHRGFTAATMRVSAGPGGPSSHVRPGFACKTAEE